MNKTTYYRQQRLGTVQPAEIAMVIIRGSIGIQVNGQHRVSDQAPPGQRIYLTAQEAMATAAWLQQAADTLMQRKAKAAARKAARDRGEQ